MEQKTRKEYSFEIPHNTILLCYTLFCAILVAEALLLSWETWAIFLILAGVVIAWVMHIRQILPVVNRVWLYAIMMMATAFFYGTHVTSTYDLGLVMTAVVLVFMSTGITGLVTLCQGTYYLAIIYDLFLLYRSGASFDSLLITRTLLHVFVVTLFCGISRRSIRKWIVILGRAEEEKQEQDELTERQNDFLANISHEIRTPINAVIGLSRICIERTDDPEIKRDLKSVMEAGNKVADQIGDILDFSEIDMGSLAVSEEDYMISSLLHDIVTEITPIRNKELELIINVDPRIPAVLRTDVVKLKKIIRHLLENGIKYTQEGGVYVHFTFERRDYGINLLIEVRDTGIGMDSEQVEKAFEGLYQADSGRARHTSGLGLGLPIVRGFVRSLNGFFVIQSKPGAGTSIRVSIPQKVVSNEYCMSLKDPENLSIGACFQYISYSHLKNPLIREFYNAYMNNLMLGLRAKILRANNLDELKEIVKGTTFTHIFIGMSEYHEDPAFIKELARTALVGIVCDETFEPPADSGLMVIRKPLYGFPAISFLNLKKGDVQEDEGKLYARGVRTLVVDDEYMNLIVARQILKGYGMTVDTVLSGKEAVDYVRTHQVDIVFMDHMMAGMDGVEAMKRIRSVLGKDGREAAIVALTANTVSTANEMFLREGFDAFLAKPIVIPELERVFKKVLPKSMLTVEREEAQVRKTQETVAETALPEAAPPEAQAAPPVPEGRFSPLHALGIDTRTGLGYCQEDEDFYEELLKQFAAESEGKIAQADRNLQDNDLKNYEILVHAVKGTAKMIGALHLSEEAYKLEKAAGAGDEGTIRLTHSDVMEEYKNLSEGIRNCLDGGRSNDGADGDVMEFYPDNEAEDEAMEFYPDDEAMDDVMEFFPEGSESHE